MPQNKTICILNWGQTLNDSYQGNISLPINLTKVINKGQTSEYLTLGLDINSVDKPIYYSISEYHNIKEAITSMKLKRKNIGYYDVTDRRYKTRYTTILGKIEELCNRENFDIAIWDETPPRITNIIRHLRMQKKCWDNTKNHINMNFRPEIIESSELLLFLVGQINCISKKDNKY